MNRFIATWFITLAWLYSCKPLFGNEYLVSSPDDDITISISTKDGIKWSASVNNHPVFINNRLRLTIDNHVLGDKVRVIQTKEDFVSEQVTTVIPVKSRHIHNEYNELTLYFKDNFAVAFRVFNNGIAYRFETDKRGEIIVKDELVELNFSEDNQILFPEENSLKSNYEQLYKDEKLSSFAPGRFCSLPMLVKAASNVKIGITEANLYDYPGLFLEATGSPRLTGKFPKAVLDFEYRAPRGMKNVVESDFIAKTQGTRSFPWRVFMISQNDAELVENQMVYLLSDACKIENTSWIKPGLVAWEWWNNISLYGVDFKSGLNTASYKYYIDFAANYHIPYIILDGGWSESPTNVMEPRPEIDLEELVAYGNERNVGLILWSNWNAIDKDMDAVLEQFEKWGVKGLKVDFMMLANQYMVNFYERTAQTCAKHQLLVNFHGSFKPVGLHRAYPNIVNYEGVKGLEHCKWSDEITPEHNVTIPFTRMLAGPMDYTPGAFRNAHSEDFVISNTRPMSLGTRCHQLAMFVVYDAPLQMISDSPSIYYDEEESTGFLSRMKTTWDETKVLDGKVGDYIVTARKNGNDWYIGAMTDGDPRILIIDLSFLDEGEYDIEIMQDGMNADKVAIDYKRTVSTVNNAAVLEIEMAPGGGWAAICTKR